MRYSNRRWKLLLLYVLSQTCAADSAPSGTTAVERRFEVCDSVEMSYFGTVESSHPDQLDDDGLLSPDGRYVVKVTHRGVLPEGVTEGTIWIFDAAAVRQSINHPEATLPTPTALVQMTATVNGFPGDFQFRGNILFQLGWSEDSRQLTFLGRDGRENRQLFRVDVNTRNVAALTPVEQDVFAYARSGTEFSYLAGANFNEGQAWWSAGPEIPDIVNGTGTMLMKLLYPNFKGYARSESLELEIWRVRNDTPEPVIDPETNNTLRIVTKFTAVVASISPNASELMTIAYANPDRRDPNQVESIDDLGSLEYSLIDLETGAFSPLNGSPVVDPQWGQRKRYLAVWSPDGNEVALSGANLPIEETDPPEDNPRNCTVVIVGLLAPNIHCVKARVSQSDGSLYDLEWTGKDQLHLRFKTFNAGEFADNAVARIDSVWESFNDDSFSLQPWLQLTVSEGLNQPPVLTATDLRSARSRVIFDPNPQLAAIEMGSVSEYRWRDSQGRENFGGLVKPPDFDPDRRYPLVIQTHGFNPKRFFRTGYSETSNAGRALAGRDIVVLQVREPGSYDDEPWNDAVENGLDVYLAAIDQLSESGMVDAKKVGITGYSYTGWTTATSITRAPDRFAAAVLANTDPVTLTGYYSYVDSPLADLVVSEYVGADPLGDGLQTWIERVPALSSDKIVAPVLFSATDPWHLLGFWDLYAALRYQGKPVELQYIRTGEHNISKPLHKLAHQEMIVDWFDFWLNSHERTDPTTVEQYARWRKLRESVVDSTGVQ